MKILIFGSRSLNWRHLPVFRALAFHARAEHPPHLPTWLPAVLANDDAPEWRQHQLPESETLTLINGDGPPGKERGAVGADKLALLACMEGWPETKRRVRWFPPEPREGETWAQAAGRRNREMVAAKPDRVYAVHTSLDASRGSAMTAGFLREAGLPFWYIQVTQAGVVVAVEERR